MYKKITFKALVFWSFIIATILSFQISEAQPCMGIPVPGNTLSTTTTPCPYTPFTLSIQNIASLGTGLIFMWEESVSGIGGPYIPTVGGGGPLSPTSTISLPPSTTKFYRCLVMCGTFSQYSNPVSISTSWNGCYCNSTPVAFQDVDIYNVSLNGNSTDPSYSYMNGCNTVAPGTGSVLNKYSNFLNLLPITTLTPGSIVSFTIEQDECDGAPFFANKLGIWIDYNNDYDFTDIGEEVYFESVHTMSPRVVNGTFIVPTTVNPSFTAMRIVCTEALNLSPCGNYTYGETEDHLVKIGSATDPCTGAPNPGITIASAATVCYGSLCNLSLQNSILSGGIAYQWYNSVGLIAGETNDTYNPTINTSDSYYCLVTCVSSGMSTASTPITVHVISPISDSSSATNCYNYMWNSNLLTASGTYTATFTSLSGCDSIHTLNLTILQSTSNALIISGCDSVVQNGITYTNTGVYAQNYVNAAGCDSVLALYITVNQTSDSTIVETGCDSFVFNGSVYTSSGIYTHTFISASGCDSNLILQLTIDTLTAVIQSSGANLSTPNMGSYQWFDCDKNAIIPGATNSNYTPIGGGSYAVIVNYLSCIDTSLCAQVWATNTEDLNSDKQSSIYPNPSQGLFELGLNDPAEIILMSSIGEIILQEKFLKGKHSLNISSYASGVYFLKVKSNNKLATYKLIKE
ncbi:MAG TPA: GEVED domain-containing protein [Chitinophagaceae bacterium]|nr:GEVED domain-containing protein [Chitinophagaceae bacterium]